jgi:hypothetical protein
MIVRPGPAHVRAALVAPFHECNLNLEYLKRNMIRPGARIDPRSVKRYP